MMDGEESVMHLCKGCAMHHIEVCEEPFLGLNRGDREVGSSREMKFMEMVRAIFAQVFCAMQNMRAF